MPIGPFTTYAPPGVYVSTTTEPIVGQLIGGLRIPVLIGTAQESLSQLNYEIVRGSSSVADTPIFNEDVTGRWIVGGTDQNPTLGNQDGNRVRFRVRNYPVVDGNGSGKVTYDASKVSVTVDGTQVVVSQIDGANGIVTLLVPPSETAVVSVSYYFQRQDTRVTDDVSGQITEGSAILTAPAAESYAFTAGTNNVLYLRLNDQTDVQVTLTAGSRTATEVANDVTAAGISGLSAAVHVDNQGFNHVRLIAAGNLRVSSVTDNAAYALGFNPGDYTGRNRQFRVFNGPIVDGTNGGITTTDTSKVVCKVNGIQVIAAGVDGANQTVTLPYAPAAGSTVTIQYYFNTFQDTFDYLPNSNILSVGNVGIAPDRTDYINGTDFVVINDQDQSMIQWGAAFQVVEGERTGTVAFDGTQVTGLLVDNRIYGVECDRYTDTTTNVVSTTKFNLPLEPTTGNGRDTPLGQSLYQTVANNRIGLPTDRPDLVVVHVGKTWRDASSRPPVTVVSVDSTAGTFTIKDPVPADYNAYATFWYNTLSDMTYSLECVTPGVSGIGKYTVKDSSGTPSYEVVFGSKTSLPEDVIWPSGVERLPDAIHYGGNPVSETVTVTFSSTLAPATHASFTNGNAEPYDIYAYTQNFGAMSVDGTAVTVNLATAFPAQLLSSGVDSPGAMTFLATDRLVLRIDGVDLDPVDVSGAASLAAVVTAINAVIDVDTQTHSDGSDPFAQPTIATIVAAANDLSAVYSDHISNTGGVFHTNPDATNLITAPAATDLATSITLLNDIRTQYEAHRVLIAGPVHSSADNDNTITAPAATDLATAIALAADLQTNYDNHISDTGLGSPYHALTDAVNGTTAPAPSIVSNSLVTTMSYGTQGLLLISGRNVQTQTNGLVSNVTVLTPTAAGQTDASTKVGLLPSQSVDGNWSAINQPAEMVSTSGAPFSITAGVNDSFLFNVDGADYSAIMPSGSAVALEAVVSYINAGYGATAPSADQTTFISDVVALANDVKAKYNVHEVSLVFHNFAGTQTVATPNATDLTTAITLLNDVKAKYNAHLTDVNPTSIHVSGDTLNPVTVADATDLRSAMILAYELKAKYNAHIVSTSFHLVADTILVTLVLSELVAAQGQGQYDSYIVLRSRTNTTASIITIGNGTANTPLGFTTSAVALRHQPTAGDIAGALNSDGSFNAVGAAWRIQEQGLGWYLRIDSLTVGSGSSISFAGGANTAFIEDTGLGIVPGSSGDVGEAARSGYTVSSSDPINGSSGTGFPGQTYTDARTGLRFTILSQTVGDYSDGGSFTLVVSETFTTDAAIPRKAIPGIEITVFNTNNVGVGSSALLTTYDRSGTEPAVGDVYYISYEYGKTDLDTALYRDQRKIQLAFGPPQPSYPLSLAARLAMLNGAVLVGLKQVLAEAGSSQASVTSYTAAIDEQKKAIEGNVKPDVIVPLTTDTQVISYLNQHCVYMSAPRQEGERTGIVGVAAGTSALGVQSIAKELQSEMMVVCYPDIFVVTTVDDQNATVDQLVDGSFFAAALAGSVTNPTVDVATPWTRRLVFGFKKIGRTLDPTEANQTAVAGVTVIEQVDQGLRVRHGLTTRMDTVITRTPSVTLIIHYVQQQMRIALDPFIGQKLTPQLLKTVERAVVALFNNLINAEIVAQVAAIGVSVDEEDPTIMRAEAIYVPIFPLEYIVASLQVRISA